MSSLKLFLKKTGLKESLQKHLKIKIEQVKGEAPTPQIVMQKSYLNIKVKRRRTSRYAKTKFEN